MFQLAIVFFLFHITIMDKSDLPVAIGLILFLLIGLGFNVIYLLAL